MSEYNPDSFVIIKLTDRRGEVPNTIYKVIGAWAGAYLYGSSWRMNSGITRMEQDDNYWYIYGSSGSCYTCPKGREGFTTAMADPMAQLKRINDDSDNDFSAEVVDSEEAYAAIMGG